MGDVLEGRHIDGDEQEGEAEALDDARPHGRAEVHLEVEARHLDETQAAGEEADADEPAGVHLLQQQSHDGHHAHHRQAARTQHPAAQEGRVAQQGLEEDGQQGQAAVEHEAQHEEHEDGHGEGAVLHQAEVHDGPRLAQFVEHGEDQGHRRDDGEEDDEVGGEPVLALPLVQDDLQRGQAQGEDADAEVVEPRALLEGDAVEGRRILHQGAGEREGQEAHGDVDEEDPVPAEVVRDPPAQHRPDDGRQHHAHAVDGHRLPPLLVGEGLHEDGLGDGLQAATTEPLEHAEEDQPAQRGCDAAEQRGDREDRHAGEVEPLPPHEAGEVAAQGQHHGIGHQVRGQHPGGLLHRGREVPRDVRQRHVGHAGVEDLHEGRDHHREGDDPGVDAAVGAHRKRHSQRSEEKAGIAEEIKFWFLRFA